VRLFLDAEFIDPRLPRRPVGDLRKGTIARFCHALHLVCLMAPGQWLVTTKIFTMVGARDSDPVATALRPDLGQLVQCAKALSRNSLRVASCRRAQLCDATRGANCSQRPQNIAPPGVVCATSMLDPGNIKPIELV
jgi:hypothetical protein